jgi:hypothetical protein
VEQIARFFDEFKHLDVLIIDGSGSRRCADSSHSDRRNAMQLRAESAALFNDGSLRTGHVFSNSTIHARA